MIHIKSELFGATLCGMGGNQLLDWTSIEGMKAYEQSKLCNQCLLNLSNVMNPCGINADAVIEELKKVDINKVEQALDNNVKFWENAQKIDWTKMEVRYKHVS